MRLHSVVWTIPLASLIVASGCGEDRVSGPAERHQNELASVDEGLIRAAVMDEDLAIEIPIHRLAETSMLRARIELRLTNVATGEVELLEAAAVDVAQAETDGSHRILLGGAAEGLERIATGPMILDWRVRIGDVSDLYGHKSLYAALGNLDVQLRGPTELPAAGTSPLRVIVRDPASHAPIANAEVIAVLVTPPATEGEEAVEHPLSRGRTDARGELATTIALPDGADGGTIRVTVEHDDVQVWTSRRVTRRADDQLYLGSDKTMYKPGQDVHLRLLALSGPDRHAIADSDVVFEARDARGNKVFRRAARTDAFGVASAVVPTDTRVNEGEWVFSAHIAGRDAQLRLPVEAYTLPKMRVEVSADRSFAIPGDLVHARVAAMYLFGEPVMDATVNVEVRTAAGIPVGNFSGRTDRQGSYAFDVTVPATLRSAALEENGDTLLATATVVDAAGQSEQGEGGMPLASAPIRINVIAADAPAAGVDGVVYVVVTDAVGRPLVADLKITGDAIVETTTNASGVAEVHITPTTNEVNLDVAASDGARRTHERVFTIGGDDETGLRVSTDRAIYRAGDRAQVQLSASAGIARAYVDVYRGAVGVLSTSVDLVDGHAIVELPITSELGGLLVVDAFGVRANGEHVRATRPVLVDRDDRLQVTLDADRVEYGPGDSAEIGVQILDASGAPRIASVGLAVVDEAVFALGGEPRTSIQSSFGLDERVLPSSLHVAGRGGSALLNERDPADREQLARLLFASAHDARGPSFDFDAIREELPAVVSSLGQKLQFDGERYLESLRPLVQGRMLTAATLGTRVRSAIVTDPFGRPYRMNVEGTEIWSTQLVMSSDGPDERGGTADDLVARVSASTLFYGPRGGGRGGDVDFAAEGRAGPAGAARDDDEPAPAPPADPSSGSQPRVRRDFRETAFVHPTLITDSSGRARVTVPLAHSITTWRVSADGSTPDGQVGAARNQLRTFQPFFVDFTMPAQLTSGDEIDLPAIVYNYTTEAQNVTVSLDRGDWFEPLAGTSQMVSLGPSEVRAARFRIRITRAGAHEIMLRGSAGTIADAIVRAVEVIPEGQPEDQTFSGQIDAAGGERALAVDVPADTVEGGGSMEVVLTPGFAAEAVQGVEALLREPNGCFEQTTATAWPNTLVAKYLDATGGLTPERREEVVGLVTRGYQRLLTFESPTGGFNWWGDDDPGNRILSAVMLWHLKDMEGLIEPDTAVRDRTLQWLLRQQQADGSFASGDHLHAGNEVLGTSTARSTAFIAWALAHTGWADDAVTRAAGWLRTNVPPESDLYANALVANALAFADPDGAMTGEVFGRLDRMRVDLEGGEGVLWPTATPSWTGSGGDNAAIETTALVAYGLMQAGVYPDNVDGAMRFILAHKDAVGTWYNTQATMNALRALSAGLTAGSGEAEGTLVVTVGGAEAARIDIGADTRDLHRRFDLSRFLRTGANDVRLSFAGTGEVSYRLSRRAYRPALPPAAGPLSLTVAFDRTSAAVGTPVNVTARAHDGEASGSRDQVIVRVGRAPGFDPNIEDLQTIVRSGLASRYEVRTDDVTFYLMGLDAGETRELRFRLVPSLPVDAAAPASSIYAYYEPSLRQVLPAEHFVATPAM